MSKITDVIAAKEAAGETWVAFEYFPPRTAEGVENLVKRFKRMAAQNPIYGDVTWGAGGSTSDLTLDLCVRMLKESGITPNMHLTCTNMPTEKIDIALEGAKAAGIRNIVALRGDPPKGEAEWHAAEGGFTCALDLVKHIRERYGDYFCVSVSGYPEGHLNAIKKVEEGRELTPSEAKRSVTTAAGEVWVCSDADYAVELAYLKEKVDAGADAIITQMFFDADTYLQFVADCRGVGIGVPIIPGIMAIQNYGGFVRMTDFCRSRVPPSLRAALDAARDSDAEVKAVGVREGAAMCRKLLEGGARGLHFYTLNMEEVTYGILDALGLKKALPAADAS